MKRTSFCGGLLAVLTVYGIAAAIPGRDAVLVLVLAGVVIGALFGAGVGLLKFLADPYNQLPAITFWLLGSLAATHPADLTSLLPAVAIGLVPLGLLRWRIDVMTLGDEEATALGVTEEELVRAMCQGLDGEKLATVLAILDGKEKPDAPAEIPAARRPLH